MSVPGALLLEVKGPGEQLSSPYSLHLGAMPLPECPGRRGNTLYWGLEGAGDQEARLVVTLLCPSLSQSLGLWEVKLFLGVPPILVELDPLVPSCCLLVDKFH